MQKFGHIAIRFRGRYDKDERKDNNFKGIKYGRDNKGYKDYN